MAEESGILRDKRCDVYCKWNRNPGNVRNIYIVKSWDEWENVLSDLQLDIDKVPVLGLDCEWSAGCSSNANCRNVSLVQFATAFGVCILVRLSQMNTPTSSFVMLLENSKVMKVGLGIEQDVKRLYLDYGIVVRGKFDVRYLLDIEQRNISLRTLVKNCFDNVLEKLSKVACSNWDAAELTEAQIQYASADAQYSLDCFLKSLSNKLLDHCWTMWCSCQQIVAQKALDDYDHRPVRQRSLNKKCFKQLKPKIANTSPSRFALKGPHYQNCILIGPDGDLLSRLPKKKLMWYVKNNLGDVVSQLSDEHWKLFSCAEEDPPFVVQLRFQPKVVASKESYYIKEKENQCVVCGRLDLLMRKRIIPHLYRRLFPEELKSFRSHDILLLCFDCHRQAEYYDTLFQRSLAEQCDAPLRLLEQQEDKFSKDAFKIRGYARTLKFHLHQLPDDRREYLQKQLALFFQQDKFQLDLIEKAIEMEKTNALHKNNIYDAHAECVVNYFANSEIGLSGFEKLWRKRFVDLMKPKFLPSLWSVDASFIY
ncbi:Exonuclease 3'-5' domain-containing protein 2 [Trichinella pseudospiralis]|uniref:Exonuclease 3'-5' domain-containing protein 2 n=1 Tax=Trichinella pseudospiralis TaxID=6337 RepID=A0A0V0YCM5_TRIPS|nr:Exonuclease 3'-5' domain-containing protein 2 [Trichinella pseudospiralis]